MLTYTVSILSYSWSRRARSSAPGSPHHHLPGSNAHIATFSGHRMVSMGTPGPAELGDLSLWPLFGMRFPPHTSRAPGQNTLIFSKFGSWLASSTISLVPHQGTSLLATFRSHVPSCRPPQSHTKRTASTSFPVPSYNLATGYSPVTSPEDRKGSRC